MPTNEPDYSTKNMVVQGKKPTAGQRGWHSEKVGRYGKGSFQRSAISFQLFLSRFAGQFTGEAVGQRDCLTVRRGRFAEV